MNCPNCGGKSKVLYSRNSDRTRRCLNCDYKWDTIEVAVKDIESINILKAGIAWHQVMDKAIKQIQEKKHE